MRIAVLASGGGSNLQAIIDHCRTAGRSAGTVVWVGANRAEAGALARARTAGIESGVITDHEDGDAMLAQVSGARAELLVLAGYLKRVPECVVRAFHGRLLNVHPALLPAFGGAGMYGERVHAAVIASGARLTGATVHFVDEEYDRGAIVAQWPVAVHEEDTPAELAARVLRAEHHLYPRCIAAVASGVVTLGHNGRARGVPSELQPDFLQMMRTK
jgi:formyltetrahydrofolate-dependent phosphoribosylglycinamide formyltransferase